jgi:tRNA dimethylallyltransferase
MSTENSLEVTSAFQDGRPPLALIAGPTASGKSDLAVRLALRLAEQGQRGVVINADSAQVYADLAVLSARPSADEMQGIEHRLFGTWDGAQSCSAADWTDAAKLEIFDVHAAGGVPILVGGTGLYIRTLLEGIAPVPPIDPAVRDEVRAMSVSEAYAALSEEDPVRAAILAPADSARIARALEVVRSTGRVLSSWQEEKQGGIGQHVSIHAAILLPDRQFLYSRCDARFGQMLEAGAVEEVKRLLTRNLDPLLPVMRAIGVPEISQFLRGGCTIEDAQLRGAQATRNYAKRQFTWLKHQPPEEWPRFELDHYDEKDLFVSLLRV